MKQAFPTKQITDVAQIEQMLNSVNLGGESSPIDADFKGIVNGTIQLSVYSGMTSKQADGSDNPNSMRPYEVGSLEIVGDVTDLRDGSILTNKKVKVSKELFETLKTQNLIESGKVKNISVSPEKWEQTRFVDGVSTKVDRYRLIAVKAEKIKSEKEIPAKVD